HRAAPKGAKRLSSATPRTKAQDQALRTARVLIDLGHPIDEVLSNPLIPPELREFVRVELERDQNFLLVPARILVGDSPPADWIRDIDRSTWYYWPSLRQYLLTIRGWESSVVRSLDDTSDRILRLLASPSTARFDIRGLVLGFVQSGKT